MLCYVTSSKTPLNEKRVEKWWQRFKTSIAMDEQWALKIESW